VPKAVLDYINSIDEANKYGVPPAASEIGAATAASYGAGQYLKGTIPPQKSILDYLNYFAGQSDDIPRDLRFGYEEISPKPGLLGQYNPSTRTFQFPTDRLDANNPANIWTALHEMQHARDFYNNRVIPGRGQKHFGEEEFHHGTYQRPMEDVWPYMHRRKLREEKGHRDAPLKEKLDIGPIQRGPASLQDLLVQSRKAQLKQAPWFGRILPGQEQEQEATMSQEEIDNTYEDRSGWTPEDLEMWKQQKKVMMENRFGQ
jgi:hypothetical protein